MFTPGLISGINLMFYLDLMGLLINEGSVKSSMKERVLVIKVEGGGDAFLRHVRSCVNH